MFSCGDSTEKIPSMAILDGKDIFIIIRSAVNSFANSNITKIRATSWVPARD
jgi:hypothetical protein